jgi:hypothetical protein
LHANCSLEYDNGTQTFAVKMADGTTIFSATASGPTLPLGVTAGSTALSTAELAILDSLGVAAPNLQSTDLSQKFTLYEDFFGTWAIGVATRCSV